jgi:hypothetical protein
MAASAADRRFDEMARDLGLEVDHIIPLREENVSGLNVITLSSWQAHRVLGMFAAEEAANMLKRTKSMSCGRRFFACQTSTTQKPQY